MGWTIQNYVAVLLWIYLLISKLWAQNLCPPHENSDEEDFPEQTDLSYNEDKLCINYIIQNIHNEQMKILWDPIERFTVGNFTVFYRFDKQNWKQCVQYVHDHEYIIGCIFKIEGREFDISVRDTNGTKEFYQDFKLESMKFLKPKSPQNVTFLWKHNKVIIEHKPPFHLHCFKLEYQYKSEFDEDWFRKNESCKFEIQGLDPEKCYSFQFRARFCCSSSSYPSEWGPKIHWKNGSSIDSCEADDFNPDLNIVLQSSFVMAGLLIMTAILLYICRLKKIRKTLMPAIPDPKNIYSDLFRDHNGNFQEWINKTENVLPETQLECIEKECIIEEEKEED
ncbi:cytokine receptor-like factor 2 [Pituophis catenifer annectens]|uniref:cytokine receptor-like factor 2 n=1 Tax=Pituophis catenifer annectens TaxID=94852 RepID=UPI0039964B0E